MPFHCFFYFAKLEKAWFSVIPAGKAQQQFFCHLHATREICWGQKLDQAKRAMGRDDPCVVTSVIMKLIVLNNVALKALTRERWSAPKPFGNSRGAGYFKKYRGCSETFREYCMCQLPLLQMSVVWIVNTGAVRLMLKCSCCFLLSFFIAAMVRCYDACREIK